MKKLAMIGCGGIGEYHLGHFLGGFLPPDSAAGRKLCEKSRQRESIYELQGNV